MIVEPSQVVKAKGCTASYIKGLWDEGLDVAKINYDTLVHSHLMEHQYDLHRFMQLNADCLKPGQRMIFALPDLKTWLKRKYSNALSFEHTYLISSDYVENILKAYGFERLEKKSFGNGHSLFYAAERTENPKECRLDGKELYQSNKKDFFDAISYFKERAAEYNRRIDESKGPVYLFGAHIFSQMLLNFGLCRDRIKCVLDNDPLKQGKRLYGTPFLVESPKGLKGKEKPMVILNAGAYTQEIKTDILTNVNGNAVIVE